MKKITLVNQMLVIFMLGIFILGFTVPLVIFSNPFINSKNLNLSSLDQTRSTSLNVKNPIPSSYRTNTFTSSTTNNPNLTTVSEAGSWQELGPHPLGDPNYISPWGTAPFSGRVTAIAINGSNTQEIYLGAAQGGVWKSIDGGFTWVPLMDNQKSLAIGTIVLSPDNKTLYVGTGEPNHGGDTYYGIGLLKSTNEGKNWTVLGSNVFYDSTISSIVINKTNPNHILVSTTWGRCCNLLQDTQNPNGTGIFQSNDGGLTWTHTFPSNTISFHDIAQLVAGPTNGSVIYAADYYTGAIWKSLDSGLTWKSFWNLTSSNQADRVTIAMTPADPSKLYAAVANTSGELSYFGYKNLSTGANTTFGSLPRNPKDYQAYGPCNRQCFYDFYITVSPTNANSIYLGAINLYYSNNAGSTWAFLGGSNAKSSIHPDQHALAFLPGNSSIIYVGNDGGVWKSPNNGTSWVNLNADLGTIQFQSIAASPTQDSVLIGGTQDNGCEKYTNNTLWAIATTSDGGWTAFYNNTIMVCSTFGLFVYKSTNGGVSYQLGLTGINVRDPSLFYPPLAQDPTNPAILYIGSNKIYKTMNFADSWFTVGGVLTTRHGVISAIAVAKSNSNILYEGDTNGIIQVSTDGGITWNEIYNTTTSFGQAIPISNIVINPFNSSIAYFALANQTNPRLLLTVGQDASGSWSEPSLSGLPFDDAINIMKFNPVTNTLFIGTDRGLYYRNATEYWLQLGSGLPNSVILGIAFTYSNYLVVATHGRGVWINYMTPDITLINPNNNTVHSSGTSIDFSITDPNGIYQVIYHWDNSNTENTLSAPYTIILPNGDSLHFLYISAQDPAGNWLNRSYVFNTDDYSSTVTLIILSMSVLFVLLTWFVLKKRSKDK